MCVTCVYYREEESLVDVFVIEMLVVLVHSLKMAHRDEKPLGMQSLPYIHTAYVTHRKVERRYLE